MSDPVIREATTQDLPRLVELLAQLSLDLPREDLSEPLAEVYARAFAVMQADPRQTSLVLEVEGVVEATATLLIVPNLSYKGRPYAMVEDVVVDSALRGSGHGERLIRECIERARAAGCYKLSLTSNKARLDAHRFYLRLGFRNSHEGFRVDF